MMLLRWPTCVEHEPPAIGKVRCIPAYCKCRHVPIAGHVGVHLPELFILLAAIVMAQSPCGFVGRGSGVAVFITMRKRLLARVCKRTRVAGGQRPRQQLDNPLREHAHRYFVVVRLMQRVLDLMAELLWVRTALQAAGTSSAGDVLNATAALEGAICAILSVSHRFSPG